MVRRSFFYKSAKIYLFLLRLNHGKNFDIRYNYFSKVIGDKKSVLEPACGPAVLPKYLSSDTKYSGFDINEKFVKHAKKRGLNVWVGNALARSNYLKSDVVFLCDALHHMGSENEKDVIKHSLSAAKKQLIICEPFKDHYLKLLPSWFPFSKKILNFIYNYMELDGHNKVRLKNNLTKKELIKTMKNGFGVVPKSAKRTIKFIGEDVIVVYDLG